MAFDTLGVNVVASGIRGVAGDIGHLALSFLRYVRAVQQADKASVKTAASQSKLADTMAGKAQRNIDSLERKWYKLTATANSLNTTIKILQMTMRDPIAAESNYTKALQDFQKQKILVGQIKLAYQQFINTKQNAVAAAFLPYVTQEEGALKKLAIALDKATKEYAQSMREQDKYKKAIQDAINVNEDLVDVTNEIPIAQKAVADSTKMAAEKQQSWADAVLAASNQAGPFARVLSDLSGAFGAAFAGNSAFMSGLGLTIPQLGAVMVAMDALKLGVRLAQAAFNAFVTVIRTVWNVLKKLVSIVWDVAKAIGKTLWNAVKKIATAPFNLVSKLFGNMGGSMQRVMEMAIGMNLSRVWWQLGMKIRDMAKMASDAAVDYQVTFNRLQALIKNEILSSYGRDITVDEYTEATRRAAIATEELVRWTSKLAVSTIYDAEDILSVYTLAMSYGFASSQAEKLTEAVLDFASGMGLGDTEMKRVIENFGQMRAQGKIAGTELRDLARGAFVPVNEVLEEMAKNAGLIGDYDVPNMQSISAVLAGMAENGELTADAFAAINVQLGKLGADGKITRQEFEGLVQDLSQSDVMAKFGLTAEQAGLALEGIKTGALTADLNELIKTGKLTIDEFFEAFIEIVTDKYPNAARSMGLTMKAVKSNISDFISTMIGWRLIAPVFEVVAKHTQDFIQNVLMSDKQIASFDRMGKAFKVVTELLMTYSTAMRKANDITGKLFGSGPLAQVRRFANEFLAIIGSLGTEDFSQRFLDFNYVLKSIGLSFQSRTLVSSGIKSLNDIMKDIMEGVEIDPAALKKSLDDVFGTLWREFFGPKIKEGIDLAWNKHIAPAIGKLWQKMKDKFGEWKTETLIPGIKAFFGETLPRWIKQFQTWIVENGPKIVRDIGHFVSSVLTEFLKISAINLGEDNPLTRLLAVFKELVEFATFKISDPTSEINKTNLDNLTESFKNLAISLKDVFLNSGAGEAVSNAINSESFKKSSERILLLAGLYESVLSIVGTILDAIVGALFGFNRDAESALDAFLDKMLTYAAHITRLVGVLTWVSGLIYTVVEPLLYVSKLFKGIDWGGTVGELIETIGKNASDFNWSAGPKIMEEAALSIKGASDVINGIDAYGAQGKVNDLVAALNSAMSAKSTPVDFDIPFNVNGFINSTNLPAGITYSDKSGFIYNGESPGQSSVKPITFTQVFKINGKLEFSDVPDGYTYNEETGLFDFEPIIETMRAVLPIAILEQPITINGKTYYNLPPGFFVNPVTNQIQWRNAQGEIYSDPIFVYQRLELVLELLSKPGWGIDPTTGQLAFTPPKNQITYMFDSKLGMVVTAEMILSGDSPEGYYIDSNGNVAYAPPPIKITTPPAVELSIPIKPSLESDNEGIGGVLTDMATVLTSDTSVSTAASGLATSMATSMASENENIVSETSTLVGNVQTVLDASAGPFTTAGTNAVAGLKSGMASEFDGLLIWWIKQVAKLNAIVPTMNMQNSPSRLYRGYGEDMMKGLQLGLESGQEGAVAQMHDAAIELRQALGAINTGTISPQQYSNVSNTTNWNVNVTTPLVASTPIQAYEILRMRAR